MHNIHVRMQRILAYASMCYGMLRRVQSFCFSWSNDLLFLPMTAVCLYDLGNVDVPPLLGNVGRGRMDTILILTLTPCQHQLLTIPIWHLKHAFILIQLFYWHVTAWCLNYSLQVTAGCWSLQDGVGRHSIHTGAISELYCVILLLIVRREERFCWYGGRKQGGVEVTLGWGGNWCHYCGFEAFRRRFGRFVCRMFCFCVRPFLVNWRNYGGFEACLCFSSFARRSFFLWEKKTPSSILFLLIYLFPSLNTFFICYFFFENFVGFIIFIFIFSSIIFPSFP